MKQFILSLLSLIILGSAARLNAQTDCANLFDASPFEEPLSEEFNNFEPDITLTNHTTTQATAYSNKHIRIEGTLTINHTLGFIGCTIQVANNAQIIANTGVLALQNSKIFSSDRMWQGIVTNGPIIHVVNTRIEDAITAIFLKNNAKLRLDRAVFNLNWIGIANDPNTQNSINLTAQSNVRFLQSGSLKPLPNGDEFEDYTIGIKMVNCSMVLGASFETRPIFYGVGTGVQATKSILRVKYGIFIGNYSGGIQGIACPSIQVVSDEGVYHGNVFCSCDFGIGINQCALEVKSAYFEGNLRDIDNVVNLATQSIRITESTFKNHTLISIGILRNLQKFDVHILSDTFVVTRPLCVNIWDTSIDNTENRIEIKNCLIDYTRFSAGNSDLIRIYNPGESDLNVQSNVIIGHITTCCAGARSNGIAIYNSNNLKLQGTLTTNHISFDGTVSQTPINAGIYALASKNLAYCGNIFENTQYGLHNAGDCDFSFISSNFFDHHETGFLVDGPGAVVGVQDKTSNYWVDPSYYNSTNRGAVLTGDPDPSKIFSHDNSANYMPPRTPEDWFVYVGGTGNNCLFKPEPGITVGELYTVRAQWTGLSESHYWDRKRALMKKLLADPDLIESDTSISAFYAANEHQSVGRYVSFETEAQEVMAGYRNCLNLTTELTDSMRVWVAYWSDIIAASPDSLNETQAQQVDSLGVLISAKNAVWQQVVADCLDSLRLEVPDLLDSLSVLPEDKTCEKDFKTVYMVMLTTLAGDTLSAGLENDLEALASACYEEYGEMVLLAIALLDQDVQAEYLAAVLADSCEIEERSAPALTPNSVTLVPVPASGYFQIWHTASSREAVRYTVYDLSGKPCLQGNTQPGERIYTGTLPSGMYFTQVFLPDQSVQTLPLIIVQQ